MPNVLSSLDIDEISLVDNPACASEEPGTGRKIPHAVVALWKRDSDTSEQIRKGKKMKFEQVLKSAKTRDEIVAAVEEKARRIAKRYDISDDAARAKVWQEHPEAQAAYEAAPLTVAKKTASSPKMFKATQSEVELDRRAKKRMRKTGRSYAQSVADELNSDPSLYERYQKELASGATVTVPEPEYLSTQPDADKFTRKRASDDDECPECEEDVDEADAFCSNCGTDLAKRKRRAS